MNGRPARPSAERWRRWGVDPGWSRVVVAHDNDGLAAEWHVLECSPPRPLGTIVCVHGNPTWSYLWRSVHHRLGDRYRVVAVDQLGMGYSQRVPSRRFARRVDDLSDVLTALDVVGPVVLAAHDWGGPISLGWALRHPDRVKGLVLCNTGVAIPDRRRAPALIRVAASGPVTDIVGHRTRLFVDGTLALSRNRIGDPAREAYRAPYRSARDRLAIADFVNDVPLAADHPSADAIAAVAEGVRALRNPTLLAWGGSDPVFNDDFAADLARRMPHARRHRFAGVGHLVVEEADVAGVMDAWLSDEVVRSRSTTSMHGVASTAAAPASATHDYEPVWSALDARADDDAPAFVDGSSGASISFAELHHRVMAIAASLAELGLERGERVAVLVPPSVDLVATVYGCWRAGAVTVVADRGLGLRGLGVAVRSARVKWVIGTSEAIAAASLLRWAPGAAKIVVGRRRVPGAVSLDDLVELPGSLPRPPGPDEPAAVLFTSGATGPAKGVRYRHRQMTEQLAALRATYGITADDRLVAAFAPFALYGPALGITSTVPDVDVTRPGTLTADALARAVESIDASIVFAAPAALANVQRTSIGLDPRLDRVRLVLSAGAPVPIETLRSSARLVRNAALHTPYGMTECLPVADIGLDELEAIHDADVLGGVCVGLPVIGASVLIGALDLDAARPVAAVPPGVMGEVLVRAAWVSDGYDQLWRTERDARPRDGDGIVWHRSGDVGHVDDHGRLWIEGRSVHVIRSAAGPITPVPVEAAVERLHGIGRVAAVGVGPRGCQQLVIVVENVDAANGLARDRVVERVRAAVARPVAAVLTVDALPVDIRHNTKIDRIAVARWAEAVLAGGRARREW